jgi:hypothetical protein
LISLKIICIPQNRIAKVPIPPITIIKDILALTCGAIKEKAKRK